MQKKVQNNKLNNRIKPKNGNPFFQTDRGFYLITAILIIVVGFVIYSNTFGSEFQFDSKRSIVENTDIQSFDKFKQLSFWLDVNQRPLALFTFAINYHIDNLNSRYYKLFNLIIHLLASYLVLLLTRYILQSAGVKPLIDKKLHNSIALLSALIFLAHPLQIQAVTYTVQRMTSLAALFLFVSIYFYALARNSHIYKGLKINAIILYLVALVAGVAGILSKQNVVVFPAIWLLYELCFVRSLEGKMYKKYLIGATAAGLTAFALVMVTGLLPAETDTITRYQYFLTQLRVYTKYVQLMFVPINQNVDYDFSISNSFFEPKVIAGFLFSVGLLGLAIFMFNKNRLVTFGILWFYLSQFIESSIFPIRDVIFEHRLYLPMFGFTIILASLLFYYFSVTKKTIVFSVLLILVLCTATYARNIVWKDEIIFWTDVVNKSPNKPRPLNNLAYSYFMKGDYDKAIAYYGRVVKVQPDYLDAMSNLGLSWKRKGDIDKAIYYFNEAIKINPNNFDALSNLGVSLKNKGEYDKALEMYNRALSANPDHFHAICNIGSLFYEQQKFDEAIEYYQKGLAIKPKDYKALYSIGIAYNRKKQYDSAMHYLNASLAVNPTYDEALSSSAMVYLATGDTTKALSLYNKALEVNPKHINTLINLANLYITKGSYDQAIGLYTQALEVSNSVTIIYGLAFTHQKKGDYDKAIQYYQKIVAAKPDHFLTLYNLAVSYQQKGDKANAKKYYQIAIKLNPNYQPLIKKMRLL